MQYRRPCVQRNDYYEMELLVFSSNAVYWPTTQPGCQNRKCTYVNNIWSTNSGVWPWLCMDWISAICDAHKKKVGVELLYNSVKTGNQLVWWPHQLERRCWNENMSQRGLAPRSPVEQPRRTGKKRWWPKVWGSICCSSVRSPAPSHTSPFQIKWEVHIFLKTVSLVFVSLWFCMHVALQQQYLKSFKHLQANELH